MQQQQDFMISRQEVVSADGNASLECFLDAEHCQLTLGDIKVDGTSVDDEGSIQRKLLIYFSVATNQPELYTAQAINEVLELSPELGGEYGPSVGEWLEPGLLRVSVSAVATGARGAEEEEGEWHLYTTCDQVAQCLYALCHALCCPGSVHFSICFICAAVAVPWTNVFFCF
jgi:hypothetical protein